MLYQTVEYTKNDLIIEYDEIKDYYLTSERKENTLKNIQEFLFKVNSLRKKIGYIVYYKYEEEDKNYYEYSKLINYLSGYIKSSSQNEINKLYNQFRINVLKDKHDEDKMYMERGYYHDCRKLD